jgi:hypothetical protein
MFPLQTTFKFIGMQVKAISCSYCMIGLILAWVAIAVGFICLGIGSSPLYLLGLLGLLPLTGLMLWIHGRHKLQAQLEQFRRDWGNEIERKRNQPEIALFHGLSVHNALAHAASIDDQTWADLNMDEVFRTVDRTLTTPGQCMLYHILRTPLLSDEILRGRSQLIQLFQTDADIREQVQLSLLRLGTQKVNGITHLLWCPETPPGRIRFLYSALTLLALGGAAAYSLLLNLSALFSIVLPIYFLNMLVTYRIRARLILQLEAIAYLGALIRTAERILNLDCPGLADIQNKLRPIVSATRPIAQKTRFLKPETAFNSDISFLLLTHLSIYFVHDVRMYYAIIDQIQQHNEALKTLYRLLGELDAMQSAASYREGVPRYVEPVFCSDESRLEATDLYHPLLTEAVSNSIELKTSGLCVTGSNMAGKTTFIRTLGLNALLAQTLYTCLADSYRAPYFHIISSINERDDLMAGKSYYLVEAEQLLKMVRLSEQEQALLCLIDEPLGGTNSHERLAASLGIIRYMCHQGALVTITTHDLQLARKLEHILDCYHFSDSVDRHGRHFDYRLKQGIASGSNALRLLEYLEYPQEIVNMANQSKCYTAKDPKPSTGENK